MVVEPRTTLLRRPLSVAATLATSLVLLLAAAGVAPATGSAAGPVEARSDAGSSVVGGNATTASRFPWQVLITANGNEFCGGTLIHPMIILTAAHCLVDEEGNYFEDDPGIDFRAYTGRTQVNSGERSWTGGSPAST